MARRGAGLRNSTTDVMTRRVVVVHRTLISGWSLTKFASRGDAVPFAFGEPRPLHYHDKERSLHVFWGLKGESN